MEDLLGKETAPVQSGRFGKQLLRLSCLRWNWNFWVAGLA